MDFLLINLLILLMSGAVGAWGIALLVGKQPLKTYFLVFAVTVSLCLVLRWVDAVPVALFGSWYWGIAATPVILVPLVQVLVLTCGAVKNIWRRAVYLGLLFALVCFVLVRDPLTGERSVAAARQDASSKRCYLVLGR